MPKIEFIATLPPIMSAINLDGMGDGARIKLDVSRQFVKEVLELQKMAGKQIHFIAETKNEKPNVSIPKLDVDNLEVDL